MKSFNYHDTRYFTSIQVFIATSKLNRLFLNLYDKFAVNCEFVVNIFDLHRRSSLCSISTCD